MRLIAEWKKIVKKAWSFRLMILAGILSTAELVLPMFAAEMPRALFAGLSLLAITGAMIARIVAQKEFATND